MKKLLVLQHVAHELLGTLNPLLKSAGFRIRYVNFARHPDAEPGLNGYDGLVVLGGPMSVNDAHRLPHLNTEMRLIEQAMQRNLPVLGICLGAQLIAKALGAAVYPNQEKEIGWYDVSPTDEAENDPLFTEFQDSEKIFQWHGDTFDIPQSSCHLAFSSLCANQAFRCGVNVYNRKEIAGLPRDVTPERIQCETLQHVTRLNRLSERVFGEFINLFGNDKKLRLLPSR
jgi:GMP synthase (glutamine-hydrolysing)